MAPTPESRRSFRRSRARLRILLALDALGEASLADLAHATGVRPTRVRWCLEGRPPAYRADLSLVGLALAQPRAAATDARVYRITARGRREARLREPAAGALAEPHPPGPEARSAAGAE